MADNWFSAKNIPIINIVISLLVLFVSLATLILAKQQTDLTEILTRGERIKQAASIQKAKERCKNSPELNDSGISFVADGSPAPCSAVLKMQ